MSAEQCIQGAPEWAVDRIAQLEKALAEEKQVASSFAPAADRLRETLHENIHREPCQCATCVRLRGEVKA